MAVARKDRDTDPDKMFGKDNTADGPALRPRDIEEVSPLRALIDKRKDLKLSDAQTDGLKKSEDALKQKNAPLLKQLDSIVHEMKPPLNETDETRAKMSAASQALRETLQSIDASYEAAAKDALATLDADQQTKAKDVLAKNKEEADKRIRESRCRAAKADRLSSQRYPAACMANNSPTGRRRSDRRACPAPRSRRSQHDDAVRHAHGREAMRDDDRHPPDISSLNRTARRTRRGRRERP